jgi:hypothetical protein
MQENGTNWENVKHLWDIAQPKARFCENFQSTLMKRFFFKPAED